MDKRPFATLSQVKKIAETYPTPFYLYDEKGIRDNADCVKRAFSGFPGVFRRKGDPESLYREYPERVRLRGGLFLPHRAHDGEGAGISRRPYHVFVQ